MSAKLDQDRVRWPGSGSIVNLASVPFGYYLSESCTGNETTFENDRTLSEVAPAIDDLAARVWRHVEGTESQGHTVVLKLKTSEFRTITRSHTPAAPPAAEHELADIAQGLLSRVELAPATRYRLAGVGLSNFRDAEEGDTQPALF